MNFEKIVKEIARRHGVSETEVYRDMQAALDAGRLNPDPQVQRAWDQLGLRKASPGQVVEKLAQEMESKQ